MEQTDPWNSLEVVKLVVAALTPIAVAGIGFWLNGRLKSLEQAQWSRQKVVERRIKAYDEMAKPLNQLLCFFCYIGTWKELSPPELVKMKRELDQTAYVSAPLFDQNFLQRYNLLLDTCFETFSRWGKDAKIRALTERREQALGEAWKSEWKDCFSAPDKASDTGEVRKAYGELMAYLGAAIGATEVDAHLLGSMPIPANIESRAAGMVPEIRLADTKPDEAPSH